MSIKNIPKTGESYELSKLKIVAFVDCSGSTSIKTLSPPYNIFAHEVNLAKQLTENLVYWNTNIVTNCKGSLGGTDPTCILNDSASIKVFDTNDVIVLITDGEIEQKSVTSFSQKLNSHMNKILFICIIVGNKKDNLLNLNISVIAPIMNTGNCLCMYHDSDTNQTYIIGSQGFISNTFPNPSTLAQIQKIKDISSLKNIKCTKNTIPSAHIILSETEDYYRVVQSSNAITPETIESCDKSELEVLIRHATVNNQLSHLRQIISTKRNEKVRLATEELKNKFDFRYSRQKESIIAKMIVANEIGNIEEQKKLRDELNSIKDLVRDEELAYIKYVSTNISSVRKEWDSIRDIIHSIETSNDKYSLNNYSFASNRSKRAETISTSNEDFEELGAIIDYTNTPLIECTICMNNGPMVLWLNKYDDLEYTTNDFCMNFPLAHFPKLSDTIVPNPVCGECAQSYIKYRKLSIYRTPITNYIPVNWSDSVSNISFALKVLCEVYGGNKILPHLKLLFFSVIDDIKSKWLDTKHKNYIIEQLLNNVISTETMSEEGKKSKLIECIKKIVTDETNLLRQPFVAAMRILKLAHKYGNIDKQVLISSSRKRYAYYLIEIFSSRTKHANNDFSNIRLDIDNVIFETFCGVPIEYKYNSLTTTDSIGKLKDFMDNKEYLQFLLATCEEIGVDADQIISSDIIINVLWHLTTIEAHERPLKIYLDLGQKYKHFKMIGDTSYETKSTIHQLINSKKFDKYIKVKCQNIPTYAVYNGEYSVPSKFWFFDKFLIPKEKLNTWVNIDILQELLQKNLQIEMTASNGSYYPNDKSAHVMLHRIVAKVLEDKFKNCDEFETKMLMEVYKEFLKTNGNYGNIYNKDLHQHTIFVIKNFLEIRKKSPNYSHASSKSPCPCIENDRSVKHKVMSEIINMKLPINDNDNDHLVFLDEQKIIMNKPTVEPYESHIKEELKNTSHLFNMIIKRDDIIPTNNDNAVIVNINDPIVFGDKNMDIAKLLPMWDHEQKDIVSKIVQTDNIRLEDIRYVGGMDISFEKNSDAGVACLVVFDYKTLKMVAHFTIKCLVHVPYKAGYLAFREAPVLLKLIDIVNETYPEYMPQLILMDGNGIWHPRSCGIATHFSVLTGIPCIGVAKNVLLVENVCDDMVLELLKNHATDKNTHVLVTTGSGKTLGCAYNSTGSIKKAIFISVGNGISLDTSIQIVRSLNKHRVNETIRQADHISKLLLAD